MLSINFRLIYAVLLGFLLGAPALSHGEKLHIVATFAPIYCFTANVAGDVAEVSMLLSEAAEPHDFAFSPSDLRALSKADVVVKNGLGLEDWLEDALSGSLKAIVLDSSAGIEVLKSDDSTNPHIWLDPKRAAQQVENISEALAAVDPANAATYRANAARYAERLRALDTEMAEKIGALDSPAVITSHDAIGYFAERYGLRVVGVLEPQPGAEPTPKTLVKLNRLAEREHVRAFLAEPESSARLMSSLARELKVPVVNFDPMETGPARADYYETTMRKNLGALVAALSP